MSDEKNVAAGKRFSRDMRRIREDREVSIDEIHNETRIARTLIQSFEEGGLYEHPTFNRVYLRSFVRAYAKAIDITPDAVLAGLDAALEGTYGNDLAVEYLDAKPRTEKEQGGAEPEAEEEGAATVKDEDADELSETTAAGGADSRGGIVGPPREMGSTEESPSTSEPVDPSGEASPDSAERPGDFTPPSDSDRKSEAPAEDGEESTEVSEWEEPPTPSDDAQTPQEASAPPSTDASDRGRDSDAPSWFDGDADEGSGEGDSTTGRTEEESHGEPAEGPESGAGRAAPVGGAGSSGIVGEPTELGSGSGTEEAAAGASAGASTPDAGRSRRREARDSGWFNFDQREVLVASIGIVVVVLVLVGLGFAFFSDGQEPTAPRATTAADTTETSPASSDPDTATVRTAGVTTRPAANVRLGETMHLTVIGDERVEEIRIQRDADLRRPYWIEEGEAEVYPFQRRITIENELSDVRLYLEGYPYPRASVDTTGELVIDRADAEAFVDTLRGTRPTLPVTPDTIPKGEPSE